MTNNATTHILNRTVCLILHCGYLGNHRKIELGGVDMEKDGAKLVVEKGELGARKRLFASKDLLPCHHAIAAVKNKLRAMSLDGGTRMFGSGAYMIPYMSVVEAEQAIRDGQAQLATTVDTLVTLLPQLIANRAIQLGPLFNLADYPTADDVRAAYKIDYNFVSFGAPERLEEVDKAVAERARADWNGKLHDAYEDAVAGLRGGALLVMQELAERLKPGADGKPKAIRETALRDVEELLGRFPVMNSVGQDEALAGILARVASRTQGLDPEALRKAPVVRAMLLETAQEAAAALGELVSSGRRAMSLPAA